MDNVHMRPAGTYLLLNEAFSKCFILIIIYYYHKLLED